ncbi:3-octaprenyl-4hydroxybenzoate decarboxylase [Desulfacinum hydrothermale DSM 13146]|uniref:3-octaprenyl-4hydroxybenzoate decarboxylase n=1 Tax=Desulfacinum hydrothermale DSM 13146 TaxID=1121390 RepID=A0A1W1XBT2_9BACT|nr:menaquinone biosynthesis decarboxylase [Desulfacinum hydrothermale]SMC21300.1 3-octaprenyl-4hydroxybenzoate decarboxylase [Desulfacinum hydrothermale DSM 13146]
MIKTSYRNLGEFVRALEQSGELLRVQAPVSRDLEITQITDLASKSPGGGKALLFEKVLDSPFPVLTNAFGSRKRICMALGVEDLDDLAARVRRFIEMEPPRSLAQAVRLLPLGVDLLRFFPRRTRRAPCQEVVLTGSRIDLFQLPILKCWPQDGGPFVTLPVVITKSLKTGKRNAGMYRLQVYDRTTTGMHWHIHKDGSHYFQEYRRAGKRMPVAVAIGTDPATTYAATAPLPRGVDEMILSGFIRRAPVPLTKAVTVDLEVPAEAEFILEGYVDPEEMRVEGPFGDHTGYYSLADLYPVFHLTAITHRRNPIYPATIVGRPPMEDCYLAKATERIFLPLLQAVLPEIKDYWLPWEGVFHNITVIALDKEYPGHARKVMSALWGQGQMSFCKALAVVDADADLSRPRPLLETVLNHLDLERDVYVTEGVLDVLDHSAPEPLFGGKIGLDATRRLPSESARPDRPIRRQWPEDSALYPHARKVSHRITHVHRPDLAVRNPVMLLNFQKDGTTSALSVAQGLLDSQELQDFSIFVFYDSHIDLRDGSLVLWKLFNNVDPKRDLLRQDGRLVVDATKKGPEDGHLRTWPDDIAMDPHVVDRVVRRAKELGIEEFIP